MKNIVYLTGILAATLLLGTLETFGQYTWGKDSHNPVLSGGAAGTWDADVGIPWVIFNADSNRYEMWYSGSLPRGAIGFAVSNDGISWTKDANPVLTPTPGSWDSLLVAGACVLRENGQYKMWYTGARNPSGGTQIGADRIGYATSPDGRVWNKYAGNPVLGPGTAAWETGGVEFCSVLPVEGGYQMYYGGFTPALSLIGRAFSADGITWRRDTLNNPVFNIGNPGAWDRNVYLPRVLALGSTLYMWYTAEAVPGAGSSKIGLATSTDGGRTWTRYGTAPVLTDGPSGSWDASYVELGSVLEKDGVVHMWYDGGSSPAYTARIGHATAPRLVPSVHHVPLRYPTIQAAIDAAINGDTVLVSDGTYNERIRFRGKKIVVGSAYMTTGDTAHISHTVIDGSPPPYLVDSGSVVSFVSGEDTNSVLCGFTITGGIGTAFDHTGGITGRHGGGILCVNSGARLKRNVIRDNALKEYIIPNAYSMGAGVCAEGWTADTASLPFLIMEDNILTGNTITSELGAVGGAGIQMYKVNAILRRNVITNNSGQTESTSQWIAGGGVYAERVTLLCEDNLIAGNKVIGKKLLGGGGNASGGGVSAEAVNLDFRRNRVIDNLVQSSTSLSAWGGGILVFAMDAYELRDALLSGNYFGNNTALGGTGTSGGGIDIWNQKPRIENNIIEKNVALYGGGICIHGSVSSSPAVVVNNTIYDNNGTNGGGLSLRDKAIAVVFNNIFWADSALTNREIQSGGVTADVNYCDVQGGWPTGTGNFSEDPQFLDAGFRIGVMSHCFEAGIDSVQFNGLWYRAPSTSYYPGRPRPDPPGTRPDIGAVEADRTPGVDDREKAGFPSIIALAQNYPNPFNPTTRIRLEIPGGRGQESGTNTVRLAVFDLLGREVAVLVNERKLPGSYEVTFDASRLSSGVYIYRLTSGGFVASRKMVLTK